MTGVGQLGSVSTVENGDVTGRVISAALKVHTKLGPGLLESAYRACLAHELRRRGVQVRSEVELPVYFEGIRVDLAYRIDLLVEEAVIVEVKTVAKVLPVHAAQLLSYLRLSDHRVGLLINFHEKMLRDGIRRMVNDYRV